MVKLGNHFHFNYCCFALAKLDHRDDLRWSVSWFFRKKNWSKKRKRQGTNKVQTDHKVKVPQSKRYSDITFSKIIILTIKISFDIFDSHVMVIPIIVIPLTAQLFMKQCVLSCCSCLSDGPKKKTITRKSFIASCKKKPLKCNTLSGG